jgi:hypothetical protein
LILIAKYILVLDLKGEREGLGVAHIMEKNPYQQKQRSRSENTILGNAKKGEV